MLIISNYCSHLWFTDVFRLYFSFVFPDAIIVSLFLNYTKKKKKSSNVKLAAAFCI